MFAARMKAATGSKTKATLVVEYYDDRVGAARTVQTETYSNVDVSTAQKFDAWVASVVRGQLLLLKSAEEDAALQGLVGRVIASL